MEPDATPPLGPEAEQGLPMISPDMGPLANGESPVTWAQLVASIIGTLITVVGGWMAIILKRKRPKTGAEDAVYEINRATIEDQRAQITALQKENDTLRTSRNEFEAAATRAETNHKIASEAAQTAKDALLRTQSDIAALHDKWEKAQRYIYTLRAELVRHNIPVPPEPV